MASAQSVIKNLMSSLDKTTLKATAALDEAVSKVSNFASQNEVVNTLVKDCRAYNGDYVKFLKDMCGIVLDNADTGAITGSDAGGGATKTAESIVPETGNWQYPSATSFTVQGLTVNVPARSSLNNSQQFIIGALYSWWIGGALTLIQNSLGFSFNEIDTSVKSIDVNFYNASDGKMAIVDYQRGQKTNALTLRINMNYYSTIDQNNPNGVGNDNALGYLDRTIAHEMVHAVMAANVDYFNDLPTSFKEGIAEIVHGIDDKRYDNIKNLASNAASLKNALGGSGVNAYTAGYILLRYLAKQAAENRDPNKNITVDTGTQNSTNTSTTTSTYAATFSADGKTLTVTGKFTKNIWLGGIDAFTGAANEYANSNTVSIDGAQNSGNIIYGGNAKNNFIQAGSGKSSLWGGAGGNDTLSGGSSADMFWFGNGCGNDVAANFTDGQNSNSDIVNFYDGALKTATRAGNNLNFTMADGSTLRLSAGDNVDTAVKYSTNAKNIYAAKIGNSDSANSFSYDKNVNYYLGAGADTLNVNSGDNEIWLAEGTFNNIAVVDASNSAGNNLMAGDQANNKIVGGQGNSSLWGGSGGNDTLIGGAGADVFWYGVNEGNDIIQNAGDNDAVNLYNVRLSDISYAGESGGNLIINTQAGSLTVTGDSAPTFKLSDGSGWKFNRTSKTWAGA